MTIKQLEYFSVLARTLNYSVAAKELYVGQPALSRSISALEQELGVTLFTRTKHNVALTAAGVVLAKELPQLSLELSRMVFHAQTAQKGQQGRIMLGILDELPILPPLRETLAWFRDCAPMLDIRPVCLAMEDLAYAVHTGELDIIFSYDTNMPFDDALSVLPILEDRFCLVVSKDSPWARQESVWLKELLHETFFFAGTESSFELHRWREICAGQGFMPKIVSVRNNATRMCCVENNYGVALLPSNNKVRCDSSFTCVKLNDTFPLQINLKWVQKTVNPCVGIFIEELRKHL